MSAAVRLLAALLLALGAAAAALGQVPIYNRAGGGGGGADLSTAICTSPIACAAGTWTWAGPTLTGTPAAGDFSYWSGSSTEALLTNAAGAAGQVVEWQSGAASIWGGPALNRIKAANAAATVANGNNVGLVWNWAMATDSTSAFTLGETTAAASGTITSGLPNQALFKLSTLATSTASPLVVFNRGAHAMSIRPSTGQLGLSVVNAGTPEYSFANNWDTGFTIQGGGGCTSGCVVALAIGGNSRHTFADAQLRIPAGSATGPALGQSTSSADTGPAWLAANTMSLVNTTDGEWIRWGSRSEQLTRGSADATAFAINARKARGTASAPTVITTGDALLTFSGYGYVGGTNTYREATRIEFDSTGTIADATTGVGGVIKLMTTKAGTDSAVQTAVTVSGGSTPDTKITGTLSSTNVLMSGTAPTISSGFGSSPSVSANNGTAAFRVNVGTGGVATSGVIGLPTAITGWNCSCSDITTASTTVFLCKQTASSTTTATIGNFNTAGAAAAWVASDTLAVSCFAL